MQKQKGVSTLVGIIIIVVVALILFGGVFAYQYYSGKTKSPTFNVQPNTKNENTLTATPTSGIAPLGVMFSGEVNSKTLDLGPIVLDYGEPQINYCSVGLVGTKGCTVKNCNLWNVEPDYHSFKTAGTYVAKLRVGKNCIYNGCIPCTPGPVISSITITVK